MDRCVIDRIYVHQGLIFNSCSISEPLEAFGACLNTVEDVWAVKSAFQLPLSVKVLDAFRVMDSV